MERPCFDLQGKTALVCGASGGIGWACARLLAQAGARLVVSGTREEKLAPLARELQDQGGDCLALAADLSQEGEAGRLVAGALERLGRLDILVNAQGINRAEKSAEASIANWDAVMGLNLRSVFLVSQAAGRHMIAQNYGRIVNLSSQSARIGMPLRAAYCASKAGVDGLTRQLAVEWAPFGVTVNAVAPTFVDTAMVRRVLQDDQFRQWALGSIPLGRMVTPEEVGYAVLYLASDQAAMITGQVLVIDGGWTAQ